jgi:hypothetical protein
MKVLENFERWLGYFYRTPFDVGSILSIIGLTYLLVVGIINRKKLKVGFLGTLVSVFYISVTPFLHFLAYSIFPYNQDPENGKFAVLLLVTVSVLQVLCVVWLFRTRKQIGFLVPYTIFALGISALTFLLILFFSMTNGA